MSYGYDSSSRREISWARGWEKAMTSLPATYEFGEVRVDAATELVTRSGAPVELEPKTFALLAYFIHHRGRLLEKQRSRRGLG